MEVGAQNAANRIAWLEKTLKQIPPGLRVLDAGAGRQYFKPYCSHLNYVAQDFGKYDGQGNEAGLQTGLKAQKNPDIISDITSIPEPDDSFDAIMCIEVFEHLPNPVLAIKEFSRLLKSSGYLILTAPFCSLTHYAPYHFYTGFNRYFYETHLREFGFNIDEIEENGNFFEYLAQEIDRVSYVAARYCNVTLNDQEKEKINAVLTALEGLSGQDKGSKELLTFGYHILARRQ